MLTQYYPPEAGAAQTRLMAFSKELRRHGHEVEVVTCMPNYPSGVIPKGYRRRFYYFEIIDGVPVHRFWVYASNGKGIGRLFNYLSFCFTAFFAIFKAKRPDIIYVNSGPLFLSIPGNFFSWYWKSPYVFNVSDLWPRSVEHVKGTGAKFFIHLGLKLEAWSYRRAIRVNAITEGVREILLKEKGVPAEKLLFLPNGVDTDLFSPEIRPRKVTKESLGVVGKFVYIYPGNHGYAHALDSVVRAASLLPIDSKVHILLVGGGSKKESLERLAHELNVKNLSFHGPVSPADLVDYIALADAGLIHVRNTPLAEETRPAKMFPIMAMAKPILYAGLGEGARLLEQNGGGEVIPSEQPKILASKLDEFAQKGSDLVAMGQRNRGLIETSYGTRKLVGSWLKDLSKIL